MSACPYTMFLHVDLTCVDDNNQRLTHGLVNPVVMLSSIAYKYIPNKYSMHKPIPYRTTTSWTCVRDYKHSELLTAHQREFKLTEPKQMKPTDTNTNNKAPL